MILGGKGATSRGAGAEPWGRIGEKGRKKKGVRNTAKRRCRGVSKGMMLEYRVAQPRGGRKVVRHTAAREANDLDESFLDKLCRGRFTNRQSSRRRRGNYYY